MHDMITFRIYSGSVMTHVVVHSQLTSSTGARSTAVQPLTLISPANTVRNYDCHLSYANDRRTRKSAPTAKTGTEKPVWVSGASDMQFFWYGFR